MTGPDSETWSVAGAGGQPDHSWNWLSDHVCPEAAGLERAGATDDQLLWAAARYAIENLMLNATHEIGEWLRFDSRRLFAAHGAGSIADSGGGSPPLGDRGDGPQGNGVVTLGVDFAPAPAHEPRPDPEVSSSTATRAAATSRRASELAAPWRYSYLPGCTIAYDRRGPQLTWADETVDGRRSPAPAPKSSGCPWSSVALAALDAPAEQFVSAVHRDVHAMLVRVEAGQICEAFHVDRRSPWRLAPADGAPVTGAGGERVDMLGIRIQYGLSGDPRGAPPSEAHGGCSLGQPSTSGGSSPGIRGG